MQKKISELKQLEGEESVLEFLINENLKLKRIINEIIDNQKYFNKKISEFGNFDQKMEKTIDRNMIQFYKKILEYVDDSISKITSQKKPIELLTKADERVIIGRSLVSQLPNKTKKDNIDKFIAITLKGEVLSIKNTLKELNEVLAQKSIKENYYIEKIGSKAITQI